MTVESIPSAPFGALIIKTWLQAGIGVPDALSVGDHLILPVWRHSDRQEGLQITIGTGRGGRLFRAEVTDPEVLRAIAASHAYEMIGEFGWSEGLYVDHATPDDFDPVGFYTESTRFSVMARQVWLLYLFSQRFLDFAEGVEIGRPLQAPTGGAAFDAAGAVKAVTGLTLGPKPTSGV